MGIEAELADRIDDLIGRKSVFLDEVVNLLFGDADGGPNGDGLYHLTVAGVQTMVPCIRKMVDGLGGGLSADGVSQLAVATDQDVTAGVQVLAVGAPGAAPKRFSPFLFAARRTKDLDVLNGGEFAEWINCLTSTGQERKIAVNALQRVAGDVIDPTRPPYNVRYDYKKVNPVFCTAGSNLIESTVGAFTQGDLGKLVSLSNGAFGGALVGYIGQVVDTKHIRIFTDPTFSTAKNADQTRYYEQLVCGTDNTAALQQAFDDAEPTDVWDIGKVVLIGGVACATQLRFGSISIVGLGTTSCGFAAFPKAGSNEPFFADKNTGKYAGQYKPHNYTLKGFSIWGQRYTQFYSSFRRNLDIRGGNFFNFLRGAPYARVEDIDSWEAQWDGIATSGAFAGQFKNIRSLFSAQVGMRMGFWDLNGENWHAEASGACGVLSVMPGANVNIIRCAYNGVGGGGIYIGNGFWPHEYGSNWTECGYGNVISNLRMQESWCHSLCFSSTDPLDTYSGHGGKNQFTVGIFDDTGNISPGHGENAQRLPGVRAMVYFKGNTCINNLVKNASGSGLVSQTNYATNAYWDEGDPTGNIVDFDTPGISNDPADWYSGDAAKGWAATARGPWGTSSSSSIATRKNQVRINGATAP